VTAGLEFDACGVTKAGSRWHYCASSMKIISNDVSRQTGLSTFSNSLMRLARRPREGLCPCSVNFPVVASRGDRTGIGGVFTAACCATDGRVVVGARRQQRSPGNIATEDHRVCELTTIWCLVPRVQRDTLVLGIKVCDEKEKRTRDYCCIGVGMKVGRL